MRVPPENALPGRTLEPANPSTKPENSMVTSVTAIALASVLGAWHLHTRRHPAWDVSPYARFFIGVSYPMLAIAAFFLVGSPSQSGWSWVVGIAWAVAATAMMATGFGELRRVLRKQRNTALLLETIAHTAEV
jgi:hypothetical protein